MADPVPREEVESEYARHFKSHGRGEVALNVRIALGALLIREIPGLSGREAVESAIEKSVSPIISEQLLLIRTLYDQQRTMLDNHSRRIDERIVRLHQPHVRPIVRGKAGHETKISEAAAR